MHTVAYNLRELSFILGELCRNCISFNPQYPFAELCRLFLGTLQQTGPSCFYRSILVCILQRSVSQSVCELICGKYETSTPARFVNLSVESTKHPHLLCLWTYLWRVRNIHTCSVCERICGEYQISTPALFVNLSNLPSAGLKLTAPPLKPGSAQGFFLLVREFFLATVALGLLWGGLRPGSFAKRQTIL